MKISYVVEYILTIVAKETVMRLAKYVLLYYCIKGGKIALQFTQ